MTTKPAVVMERMRKEPEPAVPNGERIASELTQIYDAIAQRAFEIFESHGSRQGHDLEDWIQAESELLHAVALNVTESDGEYVVRAELPGFVSKDIEILVEPRCLAISGQRETKEEDENEKVIRSEWRSDRIFRTIDLPSDVDVSKVNAALKEGILTVDLQKIGDTKSTRTVSKAAPIV